MTTETIYMQKTVRKVIPIVPYSVKGSYRNMKTLILVLAYIVFFSLPWITWHGTDRVGQVFLFDLANSRFYFFDLVIFPQDLMIFISIMVFAAIGLFISAAMYGRIFCGFFCFQTIWTDAFRMIEKFIQGEAQARIRLRDRAWDLEKIYKLGATYSLWFILAFATAVTFTLYFADARVLFDQIFRGLAPTAAYMTITVLTATTFVAAGIAKEDICRVACPYGKFQSVMQDPTTRTVVYDTNRGERELGRQAPTKTLKDATLRKEQGVGDCIDCSYCVNVCPTGVDIRKGFQIDCISCGLCIDACNHIMHSIKLPTGLIRFDQMMQPKSNEGNSWSRLKRVGYMCVLAISLGFFLYQINTLKPFSAIIQQQAQPLVTRMSNGDLKSRYVVRLTNKTAHTEHYLIQLEGVDLVSAHQVHSLEVPSGKTYSYSVDLILKETIAEQLKNFSISISSRNDPDNKQSFQQHYIH